MSKGDSSINSLHRVDLIDSEIAAYAFPQIPLGPGFDLGFLKEPTAHLLDLIDQKCHHHNGKSKAIINFPPTDMAVEIGDTGEIGLT